MFALVASRPNDPTLVGGSEPPAPAEPRTSYSERPVARARCAKARELYVPSLGRYPHGHAPAPVQITDRSRTACSCASSRPAPCTRAWPCWASRTPERL
ncbi:hypothetical protein FNV65_46295 [Streptomyces sp. S1A1-8]|nr:hypothetical protein FNV58_47710 [Streptomyces sp. RLB1-9]QDO24353.1 hypothetical protein FNV65_46295 [Streptomyces sp. S1A1-8]QDO34475.1 hypothetical protein FNV63_46315 [Streptomyces sp. S1A1-3]